MGRNDENKKLRSDVIGAVVIAVIMVICIIAGLLLSPSYKDMGMSAFGDEEATNPIWAVFYIGLVIVMAVVIILLIKFGLQKFIHVAFLGAMFFTIVFVLTPLVSMVIESDAQWEKGDPAADLAWLDDVEQEVNIQGAFYVSQDRLLLINETGHSFRYLGSFNTVVLADVMNDNLSEIIIGDERGVKILDQRLTVLEDIELDENITFIYANRVLGLKRDSLVVGYGTGAVVLFPSGSGFLMVDITEEAGKAPGEVSGVYLKDAGDDTVRAYVLTTDNRLYSVDIDFSMTTLIISGVAACVFGAVAIGLLIFHPEWWVVDATGIILGVGALTLIGISLSIMPLFILLIALAVYDAIAVYKTKHMITMASTVIEMRLPVLLVIPKSMKYSFRDQDKLKKQLEKKEERGALFIGLGDIIIPGTLVVSAFTFLSSKSSFLGIGGNLLVALFTLAGIIAGYAVLMRFVLKGNPQAGLPLLNGGAITGYMLGYVIVFQDMTLGFTWPTDLFGFL